MKISKKITLIIIFILFNVFSCVNPSIGFNEVNIHDISIQPQAMNATAKWYVDLGGDIRASPLVADLDADGYME
ncbi:MAG: hypothetical protein ACTSO7_17065, partial [Candidatus Heimdallarchaeota archaeon]